MGKKTIEDHDDTSGGSKSVTNKNVGQRLQDEATGNYVPISLCCNIAKNIIQKKRAVHKRADEIKKQYLARKVMEAMY